MGFLGPLLPQLSLPKINPLEDGAAIEDILIDEKGCASMIRLGKLIHDLLNSKVSIIGSNPKYSMN